MTRIDGNSIVARILILFVILNVVSIFVFLFYINQKDRAEMEKNVEETLAEIAAEKAEVISLTMEAMAAETENLAFWTMDRIKTGTEDDTIPADYVRSSAGVLYRVDQGASENEKRSAFFLPADLALTPEVIRMINATEQLDPVFRMIKKRNEYLQWTYIATEEGVLRIYPYSGVDMFEPYHQQKVDPFYVGANPTNNPERETVWVKPYMDYLGTGWMITCSSPLYDGNRFLGVACSDLKLDTLQEVFLEDFRLSETGFTFVLDKDGSVIYYPSILPEGNKQGQMLLRNILRESSFSNAYRAVLGNMLSDEEAGLTSYVEEGGEKKLIAYAPIEEQGWILAVEVDYNDFMAINTLKPNSLLLYIAIVAFALVLFTAFLYRQYSRPILALRNEAKTIADGNYEYRESPSGITEIKELSDAFNGLKKDLKDYTGELIQKNTEIESILNNVGGLLMIVNPDYEILQMNEKGKKLVGVKKAAPASGRCHELLLGRQQPCRTCRIKEVLATGLPAYSTMEIRNEIINNSYYPIKNTERQVIEIVVYSQRVTKKVLMEKELLQKEKLAGIGQISSAIAHELKTPLAVIKGAAYLLQSFTKEEKDDRLTENIKTISTTVENAEKTIYNLLDYSGSGREGMELIDLNKVVSQILFLSNRERIQKNITVETFFEEEPLLYFGQVEPLKTILQNVIANAITAVALEGRIRISGNYTTDGKWLEIKVGDNGCGIPESLQDQLFRPFFTTDKTGKGNGLGLWITKMMTERMQGELTIVSAEGEGTVFTLKLPVHATEEEA